MATHKTTQLDDSDAKLLAWLSLRRPRLLDAFDAMVLAASRGDRNAIGPLAIAFIPLLDGEARAALGPAHEQDSAVIVHGFLLGLARARFAFPRIRGGAIPWMKRTVRSLAAEHLRRQGPGSDLAG